MKIRSQGQRTRARGARLFVSLAMALFASGCGGAASSGPSEAHRVNGEANSASEGGALIGASRPLPVLPRGVLAPPEAASSEGASSEGMSSQPASGVDAGGLLAKGEASAAPKAEASGDPKAEASGDPKAEAAEAHAIKEKSSVLPSGFHNPMPGGVFAGYRADTGLDIAGSPRAVYAIQSGTLDYSEPGHTLWTGPKDTANCVRFKLDTPIPWKGRQITHVYYAHLSKLEYSQAEGSRERRRIEAGERLGVSGVANHSPHLHIGLLLDGEVEQYWGTFLLEDEIREVLGKFKNGKRLPGE